MEKVKQHYEQINSLVPKVTLVAIQVLIVISVFQLFKVIFFQDPANWESSMVSVCGSVIAALASFLLLYKYQNLIKEFSQRTETLEKLVNESTLDLQKANREMGQEIVERQRVQQALSESERRFRTIIQEAAIGMAVVDKQGRLMESNLALQRMLGYDSGKLQDMVIGQITHPDDAARNMKSFKKLLAGTERTQQMEERFIRSDGTVVWGRLSSSLVRDAAGAPSFVIAMVEDISQRREAEEKVSNYREQLQSLASELALTEERERRRLANDLHDHIGQALAVSKIKLGVLQQNATSLNIAESLGEVRELIEEMIRDTRSLTFELSPPVLYELGFEAAVEWLAKHLQRQHGIQVRVESGGRPSPLDQEVRGLLFQTVRELLFNVVKHARANLAQVAIQEVGDNLRVIVADNGVGFDPAQNDPQLYKVSGFGLFSIRERLDYFGGGLGIESEPGHGTRVTVTMTMRNMNKKLMFQTPPLPAEPAEIETGI